VVAAIAAVEAKNENISAGLGQCVAEMLAARLFNAQEEHSIQHIYGALTTGPIWKFLKLNAQQVLINREDYYVKAPEKILGILSAMVAQTA